MSRIISLNEVITSAISKPVRVVVAQIAAIRALKGECSEVLLNGGATLRVVESSAEIEQLMHEIDLPQ